MLGLSALSQTTKNMLRTKKCVLNLPSEDMAANINLLARTTGTNPVPEWKASVGYTYVKDKFGHAKLTPQKSDLVVPPRILECPVQMEAELMEYHEMMKDLPDRKGKILAIEMKILRVHVQDELRLEGHQNRINTERWRPTLMMFQELYGIRDDKLVDSNLAKIEEKNYRGATRSHIITQGADTDTVKEEILQPATTTNGV
jgi:flavin reductase (DIM6/NTAB) family NADH-FMN oxidoreductase RutF